MPSIKTTNFSGQPFYVGLDVHKKSWSVTIRAMGMEVGHFLQDADVGQLVRYLYKRYPGGKFFSAYEAGFCGTAAHNELIKSGINNIIINPADLPQTDKQKKSKTDVHDSRATARYLEAQVLRGIYILSDEQQELRALFRLRQKKVTDVTRANNRLRSFMHYFSIQFPDAMKDREYLSNKHLSWLRTINMKTPEGPDVLQQYVDDLIYQRKQLSGLTKKLKKAMLDKYSCEMASGLSVPGIGTITAMAILAEIADLKRFNDPDQLCSWVGLVPSERSSGDTIYSVSTQSRCNKYLRPLLIEAAWVAIRRSPALLAYYRKHANKHNNKAIIKVAARLTLVTMAVMRNKTSYKTEN